MKLFQTPRYGKNLPILNIQRTIRIHRWDMIYEKRDNYCMTKTVYFMCDKY